MWLPELIKFCCWFLPPTSFSVDPRDRRVVWGCRVAVLPMSRAMESWLPLSCLPVAGMVCILPGAWKGHNSFQDKRCHAQGEDAKARRDPLGEATTVPWAPNLGIVLGPIQSFPRNRKRHLWRQLVRYQQIPRKYTNETYSQQPKSGANGPGRSNTSSLMALLLGSSQGPWQWGRTWPLILQGNLRRGHFYSSHSFISLHPSTKHGHRRHFLSSSILQATAIVVDLIVLGAPKASVANNSKGGTPPLVLGFFLISWFLGSLFPL